MPKLLVIEDDAGIQFALKTFFEKKNYEVLLADTGASGLDTSLKHLPDIILLDLRLPDIHGLNLLKDIKTSHPHSIVYIMTAFGEINEAIEAVKSGAENYFQKPMDLDELGAIIDRSSEMIKLRQELALCKKAPYPIIGRSRAVQGIIHMINLMAENHSTTLLIYGETGTGKELIARNIHSLSIRAGNPFVDINCASIPPNILEGELFGYEPGAFTDAKSSKKGLLEIADKGTLLLDEVGDMPLAIQAKLLRVIETKTFRRLGSTKDIKVDIRVIAATNKDLGMAVKNNSFREDLFYRLNVMPITIPPLRKRTEDIPLLAEFFLDELRRTEAKRIMGFEKGVMDVLLSYSWPGNVRELRNIIERAVILAQRQAITIDNIILGEGVGTYYLSEGLRKEMSSSPANQNEGASQSLNEVVRLHIIKVLEAAKWNKTKAAKILGIARSTLIEKIKAYNIVIP